MSEQPTYPELIEAVEVVDHGAAEYLRNLDPSNRDDRRPYIDKVNHYIDTGEEPTKDDKAWIATHYCTDVPAKLDNMFQWDYAPQGWDYWKKISDQLPERFVEGSNRNENEPSFEELVEAVKVVDPAAAEHMKGMEITRDFEGVGYHRRCEKSDGKDEEALQFVATHRTSAGYLDCSFNWHFSPQGRDYWENIWAKLPEQFHKPVDPMEAMMRMLAMLGED